MKGTEGSRQLDAMGEKSMRMELEQASNHLEWLQALAVSMVADQQTAEDLVQHALQEARIP